MVFEKIKISNILRIRGYKYFADAKVNKIFITNLKIAMVYAYYCKSKEVLVFTDNMYKHSIRVVNIAAICPSKQSQLFACRKLYGQLLPEETVEIEIRSLNNYIITRRGQVYWISNWKDIVKNSSQDAYNLIKIVMKSEMEKAMGKFEINNIVMNPPYNNDLYIDFVELAHKIASDSVVAITPAKCVCKDTVKDRNFRDKFLGYCKDIVYYPDTGDVFDVRLQGGIMYFVMDKVTHNKTRVKNISSRVEAFNSESKFNLKDIHYNIYIYIVMNR